MSIISARHLVKTFQNGAIAQTVLHGIDLDIERGGYIAIMGRSGAGKSTLLYQLALLDRPSSGEVLLDSIPTAGLTERERTTFRLERLGYVFQDYALVPDLNALENVLVPLLMRGHGWRDATRKATAALTRVGLGERVGQCPGKLSGGEQQRVSIARAIAHEPTILFADEPTANLDTETSEVILKIFDELHRGGQTIVMVTHEKEYGARAQRIIRLEDGRILPD